MLGILTSLISPRRSSIQILAGLGDAGGGGGGQQGGSWKSSGPRGERAINFRKFSMANNPFELLVS